MIFDQLFEVAEAEYSLPKGILRSIAIQESSLNPFAVRWEPAFFKRYVVDKSPFALGGLWPKGVTEETERICRAMSWGLLQVMGQVARECGFVGPFLSQLTDPETGIGFGAKVLRKKLDKYKTLPESLSAYNAGSPNLALNQATYVDPILARLS